MKYLYLLLCLLFAIAAECQDVKDFKGITADPSSYENIKVIPLNSDEHASSFIIFVKESVRLHRHDEHTEYVIILEGKGTMLLGEKTVPLKKGQVINIPKGTPHAVTVTSKKPMKVLSVQCPKFIGKDRIFID